MKKSVMEALHKMGACYEAKEWLASRKTSSQKAWDECRRGDWMLWFAGKLSGPVGSSTRMKLLLCAAECARTALEYVKPGEDRPRICIETLE